VHSHASYILISQRSVRFIKNYINRARAREREREKRDFAHENIVARMRFARCNREQFVRFASHRVASRGASAGK